MNRIGGIFQTEQTFNPFKRDIFTERDIRVRAIYPGSFQAHCHNIGSVLYGISTVFQDIIKVSIDGQIIATGLGILDRDYIGLYAIHVKKEYRRQGYARQICTGLLKEGIKKGAQNAYLQVVEGNNNARALYRSLGFQQLYTYWFRVQPDENGNFPPEK